jgi:hypothetical protein
MSASIASTVPVKSSNFMRQNDGQFGTAWSYKCEHDIKYALGYGFFNSLRSNLLAGDTIRVTEIKDGCVIASVECLVVSIQGAHVDFRPLDGAISRFNELVGKGKNAQGIEYEVAWNPKRKVYTISVDGEEISWVADKDEAKAVKEGSMQPPERPKQEPESE